MVLDKNLGVFNWKRLVLMITLLFTLQGLLSWFNTPQEEDPKLAERMGIITVIFPGAMPQDIQRLVTKPLEDELATVAEIKKVTSSMRTDFLLVQLELVDGLDGNADIQRAWSKVEDAIARSRQKFPEAVFEPILNHEIVDQHAVLLAVHGDADPLVLLKETKRLKDQLQTISSVKRIEEVASPGEQLNIRLDNAKVSKHGISLDGLLNQIKGSNTSIPSGYLKLGENKASVLTNSVYRTKQELEGFPVRLTSGETLPLSEIASIEHTKALPVTERMRFNSKEAFALGVVPKAGIKLQTLGESVREIIKTFENDEDFKKSNLKISEISYQPKYVEERIHEIMFDLVKAIVLVGGILMIMLGFRVGSIVALQVPVVTAIAFGVYSFMGGSLNQISIAAFILSIGLLVDNVIVIVDGIQSKLDSGLDPIRAGETSRKEFLIPLAAGTLTTIAAFVPILLAKGVTADFTRDIGVVASIALICSYFFCILVTPILASKLLKKGTARTWSFVNPLGAKLGSWVHSFPKTIIAIGFASVIIAGYFFKFIPQQFFPYADRDIAIVELKYPEGTHFSTTEKKALEIENAIKSDKRVSSVSTFIGLGVPQFYYNLPRIPSAPHVAQFIVKTTSPDAAKEFKLEREKELAALAPFANFSIKMIAQGPPVTAPIEIRVLARDPNQLAASAENILRTIRTVPGIQNPRSTIGIGSFAYKFNVNDAATGTYGITRAEVSAAILASTRGLPVSTFRGGRDPYSINIFVGEGETTNPQKISSTYIGNTRNSNLTVSNLASDSFQLSPTIIEHFNRVPYVSILGDLEPGAIEGDINNLVAQKLSQLKSVPGVEIQIAGAQAESEAATEAIFLALPIGAFLLLISLMFEFNSFRRVGIILLTIPLCAVGSVPGLLLTNSTFGFMTLLGFFTLAGVVIHNGIFLLDYTDHRVHDGVNVDVAITEGIQRRMRPIILTAVATMVELLPMTLSKSTLWPPFAWAIISGLAVSTLMTLLVLPAVYKLAFSKKGGHSMTPKTKPALIAIAFLLMVAPKITMASDKTSQKLSLSDVLEKVSSGPLANSLRMESQSVKEKATATWRSTYLPKFYVLGIAQEADKKSGITTPFGTFESSRKDLAIGTLNLDQAIYEPYKAKEVEMEDTQAKAHGLSSDHAIKEIQLNTANAYIKIIEVKEQQVSLSGFVKNLELRFKEVQRLFQLGMVSEADLLKVKLAINDAKQGLKELSNKESYLKKMIGEVIGEVNPIETMDLPKPKTILLKEQSEMEIQNNRNDIQAINLQIKAADLGADAASSANLPTITAFGEYYAVNQEILNERQGGAIGVRLMWSIFDSGSSSALKASALSQKRSLELRKKHLTSNIAVERFDSIKQLELKQNEFTEREAGLIDAEKASQIEFKRLKQGKVSVSDVIDAEDLLKERKDKLIGSKLNWYSEWFRYLMMSGEPLSMP